MRRRAVRTGVPTGGGHAPLSPPYHTVRYRPYRRVATAHSRKLTKLNYSYLFQECRTSLATANAYGNNPFYLIKPYQKFEINVLVLCINYIENSSLKVLT